MTHDSIGLGEDGPTHQPVEQIASLRAIPNLRVLRPADAIETAKAWGAALRLGGPNVLCLTRQALAPLQRDHPLVDGVAAGAYVVRDCAARDVTLLATGSDVAIAVAAADQLSQAGVAAAVVSMPCWELFAAQSPSAQHAVLGDAPRVGVEAAIRFGCDRWLGTDGRFVGMDGFGASAPASELYQHFGLTADVVTAAAMDAIAQRQRTQQPPLTQPPLTQPPEGSR
jgi:transketolase